MNRDSASRKNKDGVGDVGNKRKQRCGGKRKATVLDSLEEMKKLPKKEKYFQTQLSIATGVSQSTISRRYWSAGEVQGQHASSFNQHTKNQKRGRT